eukprot:3216853-Amphidinium_carterae.1
MSVCGWFVATVTVSEEDRIFMSEKLMPFFTVLHQEELRSEVTSAPASTCTLFKCKRHSHAVAVEKCEQAGPTFAQNSSQTLDAHAI